MRSPIAYYGSKARQAERLVSLMPEHTGYVEPFAGSLSVLLAKPPVLQEVANDLDHRLVTFWRVLRDRGDELLRAAMLTPHSRDELAAATELDDLDELETARRVWVQLTQGRSGTLRRTGWRNFIDPSLTHAGFADYLDRYRDRLETAIDRLSRVSLESRPAIEVIDQYGAAATNLRPAPLPQPGPLAGPADQHLPRGRLAASRRRRPRHPLRPPAAWSTRMKHPRPYRELVAATERELERAIGPDDARSTMHAVTAQVYATLALAEQQRVANLIALERLHLGRPDTDGMRRAVGVPETFTMAEIDEALGLDDVAERHGGR